MLILIGLLFGGIASVSGEEREWETAWEWGNSLAISEHFVSLYYPHAMALLEAERKMKNGSSAGEAVSKLDELPGVLGVVLASSQEGESVNLRIPRGVVELGEFCRALLQKSRLFKEYKSPMTKKTLGGVCKFQPLNAGGNKYDTMVRPFQTDSADTATRVAIALILDKSWLLRRIPGQMDSLARENSHLLFWAASPTNDFYEQAIGVMDGNDTLWWSGPKDFEVKNIQVMWPFVGIKIHSYIRKIEQ